MSATGFSPWAWLPNAVSYSRVVIALALIAGAIWLTLSATPPAAETRPRGRGRLLDIELEPH